MNTDNIETSKESDDFAQNVLMLLMNATGLEVDDQQLAIDILSTNLYKFAETYNPSHKRLKEKIEMAIGGFKVLQAFGCPVSDDIIDELEGGI